ncbi:AzlD domain-containing protein [Chelatococcus sp. SYSU_G07232]|uniref:AzlD domain-containing protein n=1 Tax=Chelatococcus albus TaxID=3047466 RepID=A0ABT7ACW4_9HYPH|nr:AzlD domain-containing protein [Chelatococcus sp. SYSU_G07232]MDJ1157212.1 AzlD domain-containing protein [Chelatococcus sp. SYSU_G07232]
MTFDLSALQGDLWPYALLILVGFLPSEIWRWLAVFLSRGLHEGSQILVWVRAVATALLAGVVARLVFSPSGALAAVPLALRCAALAGGLAAFWLGRRSVFAGIFAGEVLLVAAAWAYGAS